MPWRDRPRSDRLSCDRLASPRLDSSSNNSCGGVKSCKHDARPGRRGQAALHMHTCLSMGRWLVPTLWRVFDVVVVVVGPLAVYRTDWRALGVSLSARSLQVLLLDHPTPTQTPTPPLLFGWQMYDGGSRFPIMWGPLPYLAYLTGKACYRLALRPWGRPMRIPELTIRLLEPLELFPVPIRLELATVYQTVFFVF